LLVLVSKVVRAAKTRRAGSRAVKRRKVENSKEADANRFAHMQRQSCSAAASNVSPPACCALGFHSHNLRKEPNIETVFSGGQSTRLVTAGDGSDDPGAAKSYKTATPRKTRSIRPLEGCRPFIAPKMEYWEPLAPTRAPIQVEYEGVADVKQGHANEVELEGPLKWLVGQA
jgi:hypothetical protein